MNKYEKFLDDYLTSQEGSPDAFNQQDVNIISSFFNNYIEHGGDPTKFEERIKNLLKPPEKPSSGLSHILGVWWILINTVKLYLGSQDLNQPKQQP